MVAKFQNFYDKLLMFAITILFSILAFYAQKFISAVDKLNETVTILTTEQKQNKEGLTELKTYSKDHEFRITVLETKDLSHGNKMGFKWNV